MNPNNPYQPVEDNQDGNSWFLPYVILTLILITNFAYEAFTVLQQGKRVNDEINRIAPALPQAETITRTLDALSRDIVKLSTTNAAAARIRKEFNIEIRENTTTPPTRTTPTPPAQQPQGQPRTQPPQ
ncbi:MAG: hypothetical protein RML49_05890 [Verrucomicrobiae bacterium]|nr:hypothetical protein [Verrucomicrobiae bacterium]